MSPESRTWMNLGRELSIRELTALDEENRQTFWTALDTVRERARLAEDGGIPADALR